MKIKDNIITILEGYLFNSNRREVIDSEDFNDIAIAIHSEYEAQIAELKAENERLVNQTISQSKTISEKEYCIENIKKFINNTPNEVLNGLCVIIDNLKAQLSEQPKLLSDNRDLYYSNILRGYHRDNSLVDGTESKPVKNEINNKEDGECIS